MNRGLKLLDLLTNFYQHLSIKLGILQCIFTHWHTLKMNGFLTAFFVLFAVVVFGQSNDTVELKGQISAYVSNLEGVYVINSRTEQMMLTDESGNFKIHASVGDTLVFSGMQFKRKEKVLAVEDFAAKTLNVYLTILANELNEVVVRNYNNINAVSLGIVSSDLKKFTPAERRLYSATNSNLSANLNGMTGGSISADPLLNLISGRTAMFKKVVEVEKKETAIALLEKMFEPAHFITTLSLPLDYVKGFKYYVVENQKFRKVLEMKNKTTIEFLLGELAVKYKEIVACENEK